MNLINPSILRTDHFKNVSTILTFKGAALIALILLLYVGPVRNSSDIVSSVVVLTLFSLIFLMLGVNIIYLARLRRLMALSISETASVTGDQTQINFPNSPVQVAFRLPQHSLPPFYHLCLHLSFERPGLKTTLHKLVGTEQLRTLITENLIFPHRGYWETTYLNFSLQDGLGISKTAWKSKRKMQFKIVPPRVAYSNLPILSSSNRPGDRVPETSERLGDYYDLKTYHPSDGMRKIIWKIYAKTGALVSRHPEKAINPEGQLVLFCLANAAEDHVCAAALGYSDMLGEMGIELLAGCEGMGKKSLAHTSEQLEELVTESVWRAKQGDLSSICADLINCISLATPQLGGSQLERVVVFAARERLDSARGFKEVVQVGEELDSRGITPYFILINCLSAAQHSAGVSTALKAVPLISSAASWLLESEPSKPSRTKSLQSEFDSICVKRKWNVIIRS